MSESFSRRRATRIVAGAACLSFVAVTPWAAAEPLPVTAVTPVADVNTAQPASPSGGFTFKRVRAGTGRVGSLINIQIEPPTPEERVLASVPTLPQIVPVAPPPSPLLNSATNQPLAPVDSHAGWFWSLVSPGIASAAPGRIQTAMAALNAVPDQYARMRPSYERVARIAAAHGDKITKATTGTRVSPALVLAVMIVESNGQAAAESHAGAVGLMQLMPATATRFGVTDRTDPAQSISGGVKYLDFLLRSFNNDPLLALAAYNAGEGAVQRKGGVPNYAETRSYVPKVVAAWTQARMLCLSPPVQATDRCQFSGLQVAEQ